MARRRRPEQSSSSTVTDASFARDVLASEVPVLVDFWGDHCPACRQISPILRELASSFDGRVRIVPPVLVFTLGLGGALLVGARPRAAFVEAIERVL